jgi:putative hydrolase of the HAD superfamily
MVSFVDRDDVNITRYQPVWLFDLDNTLHDASHSIFPAISANMNTYIARVLGDGVTPPARTRSTPRARLLEALRRHPAGHGQAPRRRAADFLRETHRFDDLPR